HGAGHPLPAADLPRHARHGAAGLGPAAVRRGVRTQAAAGARRRQPRQQQHALPLPTRNVGLHAAGAVQVSRPRVLITDSVFATTEPEQEVLGDLADLVMAPAADEQALREAGAEADALLNCYARLTPDLLRSLTRCRIIARYGIGVDTVPLEVASEVGIME